MSRQKNMMKSVDLCRDLEKSCRDIFSDVHVHFCHDPKELCRDKLSCD